MPGIYVCVTKQCVQLPCVVFCLFGCDRIPLCIKYIVFLYITIRFYACMPRPYRKLGLSSGEKYVNALLTT